MKNLATTVYGLILLIFIGSITYISRNQEVSQKKTTRFPNSHRELSQHHYSQKDIPDYVFQVYEYITQNNKAPEGYVGGRTFHNREKILPALAPDRQKISYREWDVHPKISGKNRGPERLVTGSDNSAYFTKDHYSSFIKLNTNYHEKPAF